MSVILSGIQLQFVLNICHRQPDANSGSGNHAPQEVPIEATLCTCCEVVARLDYNIPNLGKHSSNVFVVKESIWVFNIFMIVEYLLAFVVHTSIALDKYGKSMLYII